MDFGAIGGLLGGAGGGIGGGYSNTAQGKVIVAAFTDSINNLIKAVKDYRAQNVKGGLGAGGHLAVQGGGSEPQDDPPKPQEQGMSLAQAQAKLNALGFPVGQPDGAYGPKTRLALKNFQRSRGIAETGKLDPDTIAALSK